MEIVIKCGEKKAEIKIKDISDLYDFGAFINKLADAIGDAPNLDVEKIFF